MRPPSHRARPTIRGSAFAALFLLLLSLPAHAQGRAAPAPPAALPVVHTWILHFDGQSEGFCVEAHRSLLGQLPEGAAVTVAVAGRSDEVLFRQSMDLPAARWAGISFLTTGCALSSWARDRYLILERDGEPTMVLPALCEAGESRRGDLQVPLLLAAGDPRVRLLQTRLELEGGDLLIGRRVALVGACTLLENARRLGLAVAEVESELEDLLGRRVVAVGDCEQDLPHAHLDMYAHLVDDECVVLGDPSRALALWDRMEAMPGARARLAALGPARRSEQDAMLAAYDAVAAQLRRGGFRLRRVPAIQTRSGDVLLTWTNAVTEMRGGVAHAYVPAYGLPLMDAAAHAAWEQLGFRVHPIETGLAIQEGGAVRCLTNTCRVPLAPIAIRGAARTASRGVATRTR